MCDSQTNGGLEVTDEVIEEPEVIDEIEGDNAAAGLDHRDEHNMMLMPENIDINDADQLSACFYQVQEKLSNVVTSFDSLVMHVGVITDSITERFEILEPKVDVVLKRLGENPDTINARVRRSLNVPDIKATPHSSSSSRHHEAPPADVTSPASVRRSSSHTSSSSVTEKSDHSRSHRTKVIGVAGHNDVLGMTFKFPLIIGCLTFHSLEQAFQYLKCQFCGKSDKAASIKACPEPEDAKVMGNALNLINPDFTDRQKDVIMSLFQLKVKFCPEFNAKLRENGKDVSYAFCVQNRYWGTCVPLTRVRYLAPDEWDGHNNYGKWLNEFTHKLIDDNLPEELPFDCLSYCNKPEFNKIDVKKTFIVLTDLQMDNVMGVYNTEVKHISSLTAVSHLKTTDNTALHQIKIKEEKLGRDQIGAVLMIFGTYEVGKDPEKIEKDYIKLFGYVTEKLSCPIYVANTLPRTDRFSDKVTLANYAINIAARKFEDRINLIELYEAFSKLANWRNLLNENGFALNPRGRQKLVELLADRVPFLNFSFRVPAPNDGGGPGSYGPPGPSAAKRGKFGPAAPVSGPRGGPYVPGGSRGRILAPPSSGPSFGHSSIAPYGSGPSPFDQTPGSGGAGYGPGDAYGGTGSSNRSHDYPPGMGGDDDYQGYSY